MTVLTGYTAGWMAIVVVLGSVSWAINFVRRLVSS